MAGLLTTASTLQCPHGGQVKVTTSNTRVNAASSPAVCSSDTFTISGCSFALPPPVGPHPCVRVQWVKASLHVKVVSAAVLTEESVGLCLAADSVPQGSVLVNSTQAKVSGK